MNKKLILVIGLILLFAGQPMAMGLFTSSDVDSLIWSRETVDSVGDVGAFTSLALDSLNNPHISYFDYSNYDLKYARWTGSSWSIQTVDSAGDVGRFSSLALDSKDRPHISYYDWTKGDLKYAHWTGLTWSNEIVDRRGEVGLWISIDLDSNDNPHISYYDGTNGALKYARWSGSAWSIETVDSAGWVGAHTSIALDSGDHPHISYDDSTNDNLKYARWTGKAWNIETVDSTGDGGSSTSIALDSKDRPHIGYSDSTNRDLKYAIKFSWYWTILTVDSAGNVGYYTSLALDSGDNPHISYFDNTNENLKYARWTGRAWIHETVDSAGRVGYHTSIALDSLNNPHISYCDGTNIDLKYARTVHARSIRLESRQDTGATSNLGRIKFAGSYYSLPTAVWKADGSYAIDYEELAGYRFVRWETSGGVSVVSPTLKSTMAKVTGDGTLRAIYKLVPVTYSIRLDSRQDTGATSNLGRINFAGKWFSLPTTVSTAAGSYAVDYEEPAGYRFVRWETSGDVSVTSPTAKKTTAKVKGAGTLRAIYKKATGWEYNFRLYPLGDIVRINLVGGTWMHGICEGSDYSVPVLGIYEHGWFWFAVDLTGDYEMSLFYIFTATMDGIMYRIRDDLSLVGPTKVWATSATAAEEAPALDEGGASEGMKAAVHSYRVNPLPDVIHVRDDILPWFWGDVTDSGPCYPAPLLGYLRGDKLFFASDYIEGCGGYELAFFAGNMGTGSGYFILTKDGYGFDGPTSFKLTSASSGDIGLFSED